MKRLAMKAASNALKERKRAGRAAFERATPERLVPAHPASARPAPNRANVPAFMARRLGARNAVSSATQAKNEFGRLLERAIQGDVVVITKHDRPKAVLISVEEFEALSRAPEAKIDSLSAEFNALLTRMQAPGTRGAMDAAFHASPAQLGKAAVRAARKRG